jgi:hypothetical protein
MGDTWVYMQSEITPVDPRLGVIRDDTKCGEALDDTEQ